MEYWRAKQQTAPPAPTTLDELLRGRKWSHTRALDLAMAAKRSQFAENLALGLSPEDLAAWDGS